MNEAILPVINGCARKTCQKACRRWANCGVYVDLEEQARRLKAKEHDNEISEWYADCFRADCSGAPDIIANG